MKNIGLFKSNNIVELKILEYPSIKEDYSIIKVNYMGICKTDISVLDNEFSIDNILIGHEISGSIIQSEMFRENDYVGVNPYTEDGMKGLTESGYFAKYISVPNEKIFKVSNKLLATYLEPVAASLIDIDNIVGTVAVYGQGRIPRVLTEILKQNNIDIDLIYDNDVSDKKYDYIINSAENKLNQIIDRISINGTILLRGRRSSNEMFNTLEFIRKGLTIESSYYSDFSDAVSFIENNEDFLIKYMGEIYPIQKWEDAINVARTADKKVFLQF